MGGLGAVNVGACSVEGGGDAGEHAAAADGGDDCVEVVVWFGVMSGGFAVCSRAVCVIVVMVVDA